MIDSTELTRQGWIRHLATLQGMLHEIEMIHGSLTMAFQTAECERERDKNIAKSLRKLQELVWESGAVSERIHRERGDKDEDFDEYVRDTTDPAKEHRRERLHRAAKDLATIANGLWDPGAPEVVEPDAVYPGETEPQPAPQDDPNQMKLPMSVEPPVVDARRLVDFKMKQANDDTATPEGKEGGE